MNLKNSIERFLRLVFGKKPIHITAQTVQLAPTELLKGRIALVTGGTGGIGFAIADAFLRAGAQAVIITGRSEKRLKEAADKLTANGNNREGKVFYEEMDIREVNSINEHFNNIINNVKGDISILVNNAGVLGASFGTANEEGYDSVLDTNLKGTFFLSQHVAHYMKDNKIEGNILNICSSSSLRPASSAYTLSKWGLRGLTMGMARQLAPHGIVVNGLAPGPTATPMLNIGEENSNIALSDIPAGRYATADEMGNMAVVLTSGMGRMIIGDIIFMTGGAGVVTYDDIQYHFD